MEKLTPSEARRFAAEGTRTGKLALVRRDGRALVAPIWFIFDGDDLVFMTHADTVEGERLVRVRVDKISGARGVAD